MTSFKSNLMRSAAALPITLGLAAGVVAIGTVSEPRMAISACNPCAATKAACNPCAAAKACNPCNPCAAAKASNPCAAAKACNPCAQQRHATPATHVQPQRPATPAIRVQQQKPATCQRKAVIRATHAAARPCNPCNPCAASAGGAATGCYVPRLKTVSAGNPCAAAKACNPCNRVSSQGMNHESCAQPRLQPVQSAQQPRHVIRESQRPRRAAPATRVQQQQALN